MIKFKLKELQPWIVAVDLVRTRQQGVVAESRETGLWTNVLLNA